MQRVTGLALWRQIAQQLSAEIRRGVFKPGDKLPTEASLAERFAVNRHTLRRAMSELQEQGVVRIEQGRGTFVQEDVIDYPIGKRTRFTENIVSLARRPGGRLLQAQEIPAEPEVAKALGLKRDAWVILIERLYEVDGRPLSVTRHYFPKPRFEGLIDAYRETGSITQSLFRLGLKDYFRESTRAMADLPDAETARLLQQARSQPIVVAESINVDPDGQPVEYAVGRYAGQRVQLVFVP